MTIAADPIDVSRVPVYPVVRLELRVDDTGATALLNGEEVGSGDPAAAQQALLSAAAAIAAHRPSRAIRARLVGLGDAESGVVGADGQLLPFTPPAPRRSVRKVLLVWGVALLAVTALFGLVQTARWAKQLSTPQPTPEAVYTPPPVQLPVLGPEGWSSVARWSIALPPSSSSSAVIAAAGLVYVVAEDGSSVVAVDASTGIRRWVLAVQDPITGGPVMIPRSPAPVIAVWTSKALVTIDATTGTSVGNWPLGVDLSQVTSLGAGVVATGQGQHAQVLAQEGLLDRVVPASAVPVGVTTDGSLVAAGAGRAWLVQSASVAGDGVTLDGPAGMHWVGAVGVARGQLVAAFSDTTTSSVVLRAFALASWAPTWTTTPLPGGRYVGPGTGSPLMTSPDGTWGTYGSTLLDLGTGKSTALPADWTSTALGQRVGFGVTGGAVLAVTPDGARATPASVPGPGAPAVGPAAATDQGWALIVARDGAHRAVYAVPPVPGSVS